MSNELPFDKLRRIDEFDAIACDTTEQVHPLEEIIGQERAVRSLKFGIEIEEPGFNVYVSGYPGTGRKTAVKDFLDKIAKTKLVPSDWCYVNNFSNPYEPKALKMPAGYGKVFKKDISKLIVDVRRVLPRIFESDDYTAKRDATVKKIEEERDKLLAQLNRRAQAEGFAIRGSEIGLLLIPLVNGKPMNEEDLAALNEKDRSEIEEKRNALTVELRSTIRQIKDLEIKASEEIVKMNREVTLFAVGNLVSDLKEKYKEFNDIIQYLDEVQNDILENFDQFIKEPESAQGPFSVAWMKNLLFKKYEVNVIVDNSNLRGAPVILELNPTYQNLFGRIEKEAQFGVLQTDFTMIHSGSLHKSNGGYLVIPVEDLLRNPLSWDSIKTALTNRDITIEEPGERLGLLSTKGLRPEPIPLNVKAILIGSPVLYQLLYTLDMSFKELFKVKADFDISMSRTKDNVQRYASFICTICKKEKLKHLDKFAVAKIVEFSSRLAEDQQKLTTRFADIADIIREADFYARQVSSNYISVDNIEKAIEEKGYRSSLIQDKIREMIQRNILLIDTKGEVTGQANGLSVITLGDISFGIPSRVTATVGIGREGIIDIEREAEMGGPIHTKGVMILSGYLAERYAQDKPLTLSTRLVFEQNYEGVEGDSASSTELYAILSALSGFPIKQSIALTGSVNQKGQVQAIGGVNEKIEGYYEVCKAGGLTGEQGVMIPRSNMQNLMLKEEVVEAVKNSKFHIYAVDSVDEGIEVLTGAKSEEVNYKVNKRLSSMMKKFRGMAGLIGEERRKQ